jgi:hypothetical protein
MTYGNDHPCLAMTINIKTGVYDRYGKYDLALDNNKNELRIYVMTYGNNHQSVVMTINYKLGV